MQKTKNEADAQKLKKKTQVYLNPDCAINLNFSGVRPEVSEYVYCFLQNALTVFHFERRNCTENYWQYLHSTELYILIQLLVIPRSRNKLWKP